MTEITQEDRKHALACARLCSIGGEPYTLTIERAAGIAQWLSDRPNYADPVNAVEVMAGVAAHANRNPALGDLIEEATAIYEWLAGTPATPEPEAA